MGTVGNFLFSETVTWDFCRPREQPCSWTAEMEKITAGQLLWQVWEWGWW